MSAVTSTAPAIGQLHARSVFGVKGNVRNNIAFVEDAVVVYPAGDFVVKAFTSSKQQEFMPVPDSTGRGGVTAMALSSSRRYCAVAAKASPDEADTATISVFNVRTLSRRRTLTAAPHANHEEYISICFNLDDSLILALSGAPDFQLTLFSIEKGRCVSMMKVITPSVLAMSSLGSSPIPYACSFSPVSLTKAVVYGRGILSFYTVDELSSGSKTEEAADEISFTYALTSLQQNMAFQTRALKGGGATPATDYTAHTWLGDDISIGATASGELLLFKRDQFLRGMEEAPRDGRAIDALAAYSKGFVAGGEAGAVHVYEYSDSDDPTKFARIKSLRATPLGIDCEDRIRSIAISPSEETAALAVSGSQIIALDLAHANVKDDTNAFTSMALPSHGPPSGLGCGPGHRTEASAILSIDMAVRKPLVATVGVDNTVRIWNYIERTCEVMKVFPEGPTSVAFHPSGFQLLVGFADKLRLQNVLMEDIRDVRDFPIKSCSEVRFSRGGHLFAAVNGSVVQIYSTYTGEYVQTLRGHNGRVTCIQWAFNDATLLSCSSDGAIYEWDMSDSKRARDFFAKGIKWHSVAAAKDCNTVYAVGDGAGSDGNQYALREIDMTNGSILREFAVGFPLTSVAFTFANPKMLFVTSGGEGRSSFIRSFSVPLGDADTTSFVDFPGCAASAVKVCTSHDDSHLAVAGADGSLIVYEVRDKDGRLPMSEFAVKVPWGDEVQVTVSDLDDKKTAVRDLRDQVAELQSNNDYAIRMMDIMFQEKLKKITERYTSELESERQQYDLLREEKLDAEREYTERLNSMEVAHRSEMQKRESLYQGKIMEEVERYQALQSDVDGQRVMWQNKRSAMVAAHNQYLAQLTNDFERRFEAARDRRHELEDEVEGVKRDWDEMKHQMEEDLDREVESIKRSYQERLDAERDATLKYKGENGIMMKKFAVLTKEKDEVSEEIKRMTEKQKGLRSQIQELEKEIQLLRVTIHEKDVNIAEKEKRIYELKKKNQELEKFKFVLDYKIKELKQQIEPRENEIAAMKKQIKEVDAELEAYHKSNAELDELIGKLRGQLDALQQQAGRLRSSLIGKESAVKDFSSELHDVMHSASTADLLVSAVNTMHAAHSKSEETAEGSDGSVVHESERQRSHLSDTLEKLKGEAESQTTTHKAANLKLIDENMHLISQIKTLRDQVAAIRAAQRCWNLDRVKAINILAAAKLPIPVSAQHYQRSGTRGASQQSSSRFTSPGAGEPPTSSGSARIPHFPVHSPTSAGIIPKSPLGSRAASKHPEPSSPLRSPHEGVNHGFEDMGVVSAAAHFTEPGRSPRVVASRG